MRVSRCIPVLTLVLALCNTSHALLDLTGSIGVGVSVKANTATTIEFADGTMLQVTTDSDADVTLKAVVTATITGSASLPTGASALSFGTHGGLELMVEGGSMISATVTTPPLSASAQALITGSVEVGCLMFDAQTKQYTEIDIDSYNTADKSITMKLPEEGTYVFVAVDSAVSVDAAMPVFAWFGEAKVTVAGEARSFAFQNGLQIGVKTQSANSITVTRTEGDDSNPPAGKIGLGFVLDVELEKEETIEGTFELAYDATVVAAKGIAESSLKLMFKAESGAWEEPDSVRVDTSAKVIVATTSHFSKWSVYGDATASMSATVRPKSWVFLAILAGLSCSLLLSRRF